jgi:hypothetical protein
MKHLKYDIPRNVEQAVEWLACDLSFRDRSRILNLGRHRLGPLHRYLKITIRSVFYLGLNRPLLDSCRRLAGKQFISEAEACELILSRLKQRLSREGALRIVK